MAGARHDRGFNVPAGATQAMKFRCPACGCADLAITAVLQLDGDLLWDEIAVQTVACPCGFHGAAVYEEERRGRLEDETWRHHGYRLTEDQFLEFSGLLAACPAPHDDACTCPAHRRLGAHDALGMCVHVRAVGVPPQAGFPMGH